MKKNLLTLTFLVLTPHILSAQWQPTTGIYGADIRCSAVSGSNVFIGTMNGVFLSTNNGNNWTELNKELTFVNLFFCPNENILLSYKIEFKNQR